MVAYGQSDGRVMFNVLRITVYMSAQKVRAFSPACLCRMAIQASVGD